MGLYDYVMSNPYGSTSNNFFYKNSQTGEDFSILNNFQPIAGRDEVWNFQRQELAALQKNVGKGVHQKLNEFILSGNLNSGPSEYMAQQNQTIENATAKIWENIQALRDNGKDWEEKWKQGINTTQERNRLLAQLRDAMIDVKKKANINSPIYEEDLQHMEEIVSGLSEGKQVGITQFMKNLNQFQGELLEEIGTAWFNQRVPRELNLQAVTTAKVYKQGATKQDSGQLIQDMLIFSMDNADILDGVQITYIIGKDNKKTVSLGEFLNLLQNYSGSEQIKIDDEAYDMLVARSEMGIQAKSGKNQLPWNRNAQNKISISDFAARGRRNPTIAKAFLLLNELKQLTDRVQDVTDQPQLMANYGLATCFSKFMHLDATGNQYLLTPKGFMTYYDRIMELHDQYNSVFTLTGVHAGENIHTAHDVSFYVPW